MGSEEVLESSVIMDATVSSCNGSVVQHVDDVEESENPGVNLLKDLDLYWEDIEDRLTISRMVSDSVIKGMVSAVEQEAVEKIARKELELAGLRETLHLDHVGADDNESSRCSRISCEVKSRTCGLYATYSDAFLEHDRLRESLGNLKIAAEEQFKKLKIEIEKVRGSSSTKRKSSASKLVGLGGVLSESDNWDYVDRMFNSFRTTLDSFYKGADDVITRSKSSLLEWQQQTEFQAEIEGMVMQNCIRSLQEEFEQRLWDQNTSSHGNGDPDWLELVKEISSLRQELDTISKSLAIPESGQLISHGSLESRKSSGNHVPSTTSLWEGNGKNEESIITMPENLDAVQLKHLSRDALFNYFKTEITKMKRHHELKVQEMTEDYFSLKRDYLKERGSSLPVRKDKEFDMLKKKIPDVILKLDDILVENEKLPKMSNNAESLDSLKDRLESLCLENHELQDLLTQKKREIKFLSSQVSDAVEKTSEQSLAEVKLLRTIAILKSSMEDAHIEASISQDLHQFLLREFTNHIKCSIKESDLECDIMEGIYQAILREVTQNAKVASKFEIEDSDMESFIMQGLCKVIFQEAFREAEEKISDLNLKYIDENFVRLSLEMELVEKEKALRSNISQKEKLEQGKLLLAAAIQKKEKLVQESADALKNEREKFELASQELDSLRMQSSQQHLLISKGNEELQIIKRDLDGALEKNKLYKLEIDALQETLHLVMKSLRETDEEKSMLLAVSSEKQSLFEAREREHREQLESIIVLVNGLSRAVIDFESKASKDIKRGSLRLETLSSQLASLIQNANSLKRTGLLYKQKLERRCSDLHKAEAEVDLLGDEVGTLLSLLEKIYIALDHYSPILRHYPGITEILKLIRRELSGESLKPV